MSERRECGAAHGARDPEPADAAYEHLMDLYEDSLGARPAPGATPAELVAAIHAAAARLGLTRTPH